MNKQPNVVVLFSDQQRWDTLGCYGQKLPITPNLDQMAHEGTLFEYAFTCQPVCGPARACIQTGMYASQTGCIHNNIALPKNQKTIAHYLSEAGYEVGYIGKWHLASQGPEQEYREKAVPLELRGGYNDYWLASDVLEFTSHGYDGHMYDSEMNKIEFKGYRADCVTDFVIDYIHTRNNEKPFYLFVSYVEPHNQNDRNRYEGPEGSEEKFKDYEVPGDLIDTKGDWEENYPDYLGACNSLDQNLGRIRNELKNLKIDENTIIIYFSDHGSHFKTRNDGYKQSCHEASIRIPMIAYGPGFKDGGRINEMVSQIDIAPTILHAAGVVKPDYMKGRPLQLLSGHTKLGWDQEIFVQITRRAITKNGLTIPTKVAGRCIRTKKWKYAVYADADDIQKDGSSDLYIEKYLYDLEIDQYEKSNLINDISLKSIREELSRILKRKMAEAGEKVPEILPCSRG